MKNNMLLEVIFYIIYKEKLEEKFLKIVPERFKTVQVQETHWKDGRNWTVLNRLSDI